MSSTTAYDKEIQALQSQIRIQNPTDILQFCADYFIRRLAEERVQYLSKNSTVDAMSGATFKSPFAANSNPFGNDGKKGEGGTAPPAGLLNVVEEDENDVVTSPTTPSFGFSGTGFRAPFGGDAPSDGPPSSMRSPPNPDTYPPQYNFGRRTSVSAESLKPVADNNDNWTPPSYPKNSDQLHRLKTSIEGNFLFSHLDDEQTRQILGALVEKPIPAKGIKVRSCAFWIIGCGAC
jgi:cAMP-dependent protein kinase regulator